MDVVLYVKVNGREVPVTLKQYSKLFGGGGLKVEMPKETYNDKEEVKEKYKNIFPQHFLNTPNMTNITSLNATTPPASTSSKDNVHEKQGNRLILKKKLPMLNKKPTVKPTSDSRLDGVSGNGEPCEPSTSHAINDTGSRSQSPDHEMLYVYQNKKFSDTLDHDELVSDSTSTNDDDIVFDNKEKKYMYINKKIPIPSTAANEPGPSSQGRQIRIHLCDDPETLNPNQPVAIPQKMLQLELKVGNTIEILNIQNVDFASYIINSIKETMEMNLSPTELATLKENKSPFVP